MNRGVTIFTKLLASAALASLAFGALWTVWGTNVAFLCFGAMLVAAVAFAAVTFSRRPAAA